MRRSIACLMAIATLVCVSSVAVATNNNDSRSEFSGRIGQFYTITGYEVVTAPDNFFYSHAYQSYHQPFQFGVFAEPFTHTGALAGSGTPGLQTEYYGGWTAGWDTGHDGAPGNRFDESQPIGSSYYYENYLYLDIRSSAMPTGSGDAANDAMFREFSEAVQYQSSFSLPYSRMMSAGRTYSGTTLLVGGLTHSLEGNFRRMRGGTEMPLLADIPMLCKFFTGPVYQNQRGHLLIMVTPRLADPIDCE